MNRLLLTLAMLFVIAYSNAQNDARIAPGSQSLSNIERMIMPALDNKALYDAEMARRAPGIAPRFAQNIPVEVSPNNHGTWEILPDGNLLWRLRIYSAGAKTLNLGFDKYIMPHGGSLILYSPDHQSILGPFTPADNEEHEELWTPVLKGDEVVIEVKIPIQEKENLKLHLSSVNHDFLGFLDLLSGSCNLDVICGAADGWAIVDNYRDIIQSVAVIGTGGGTFCTGFLVNNTRQDCTPFFMTANHCGINGSNAPSLVAYWNFFNSTCRQPNSGASGGPGNGVLTDFNTGAIFKAGNAASDFTLVQLDDPVSPTANAFFAGWNADGVNPTSTVCVHHPNTDEKRISFDNDPANVTAWTGTVNDHWLVNWDIGVTEPGSSGSPLFDQNKRIVGQLHGGASACGSSDLTDEYGMFGVSWTGGGTPSTRLDIWLDPDNTGLLAIDGRYAQQCAFSVDPIAPIVSLCAPDTAFYQLVVSPNFEDSVDVTLSATVGGLPWSSSFSNVPPGDTILVIIPTALIPQGTYPIAISATDGSNTATSNATLSVFSAIPGATTLISPADGETDVATLPAMTWSAGLAGSHYDIEIATDPLFANIVSTASGLSAATYSASLQPNSVYYWHVRTTNTCGNGEWSGASQFKTANIACNSYVSSDVPVAISEVGTPVITSTLVVPVGGAITDVNVTGVMGTHSWINDLSILITSPSGTTAALIVQQCNSEDNFNISFDDEAAPGAPPCPYNDGGYYQPASPLSVFDGEPAAGVWTLTIEDAANQDGGSLNGWGLDICAAEVSTYSVSTYPESYTACAGSGTFTVLVTTGTAFDTSGVTLSIDNAPAGSIYNFSPNPVAPGDTSILTITPGAIPIGNYTFNISGTDGAHTESTSFDLNITGDVLAPNLITPNNNAVDIPTVVGFTWNVSAGATSYLLQVATDAGFTAIVSSIPTTQTSATVNGLGQGVTYYWRVLAYSPCTPNGIISEVRTFTTLPDISFSTPNPTVQACTSDSPTWSLNIGSGFSPNGVTLTAAGLPNGASIVFSPNPAQAGGMATATLSGLIVAGPGNYTLTFTASDGVHSNTIFAFLIVNGSPDIPQLSAPSNFATNVSLTPTLIWQPVDGATNYLVQISTNLTFSNIVYSANDPASPHVVATPLLPNTQYYWRITAQNNCGGSVTLPNNFTTTMGSGVNELNGNAVAIQPNPTSGQLSIAFGHPVDREVRIDLFAVNGQLLQSRQIPEGDQSIKMDLGEYPSGIYLVRLVSGESVKSEKIIKE